MDEKCKREERKKVQQRSRRTNVVRTIRAVRKVGKVPSANFRGNIGLGTSTLSVRESKFMTITNDF